MIISVHDSEYSYSDQTLILAYCSSFLRASSAHIPGQLIFLKPAFDHDSLLLNTLLAHDHVQGETQTP